MRLRKLCQFSVSVAFFLFGALEMESCLAAKEKKYLTLAGDIWDIRGSTEKRFVVISKAGKPRR